MQDDPIGSLDLNLLRVFVAVLETRSATAAAARLGLTQSAVSNALRRLREACGDALFVRTPDGMTPTPYAKQAAEPIVQALRSVAESLSRRTTFDAPSAVRTFTIRMTDIGEAVFVPALAAALAREAPQATLRTVLLSSGDTGLALARGEVDLAIGFLPQLEGDWYQQRLFEQRYVCVGRAGHPAWRAGGAPAAVSIDAEAFGRAQHLVIESPGSGHMIVEDALERLGVRRRAAVRLPDFVAAMFVVAQTDLLCTVPQRLADAAARLAPVQWAAHPHELPCFRISQYWHALYHRDPANAWLRRLVASRFGA